MRDQSCRRLHDDRDAGLVVGAEQRRAVGGDDRLALHAGQVRILGHPQDLGRIARQDDVLTVVVRMNEWLDVVAAGFRRGVDVGDPGDGRAPFG